MACMWSLIVGIASTLTICSLLIVVMIYHSLILASVLVSYDVFDRIFQLFDVSYELRRSMCPSRGYYGIKGIHLSCPCIYISEDASSRDTIPTRI